MKSFWGGVSFLVVFTGQFHLTTIYIQTVAQRFHWSRLFSEIDENIRPLVQKVTIRLLQQSGYGTN